MCDSVKRLERGAREQLLLENESQTTFDHLFSQSSEMKMALSALAKFVDAELHTLRNEIHELRNEVHRAVTRENAAAAAATFAAPRRRGAAARRRPPLLPAPRWPCASASSAAPPAGATRPRRGARPAPACVCTSKASSCECRVAAPSVRLRRARIALRTPTIVYVTPWARRRTVST